jgi:signal transduction histidine kinase
MSFSKSLLNLLCLALLFVFAINSTVHGQSVEYTSEASVKIKPTQLQIWVDSLSEVGTSDWETIHQKKTFIENPYPSNSIGFKKSAHWYKVSINNTGQMAKVIFKNDYPLLDSISIFHVYKNELKQQVITGDQYPFSSRAMNYTGFGIKLNLLPGVNEIYIRIHTTSALRTEFILEDEPSFFSAITTNTFYLGLFFGWLAVMVCYNMFLFISIKEPSYLFMSSMTATNLLMFMVTTGLGMQYWWSNTPFVNETGFVFLASLVGVFSVLFVVSFFDLKKNHPILYTYNKILGSILLLFAIASFFTDYNQIIKPLMLITFHDIFFFPITAVIMHRKGFKGAKLFIFAWVFYLFGSLMALSIGTSSMVPEFFKSFNYLEIGVALEVLFFSLALGNRINILKDEVAEKELEKLQLSSSLIKTHNITLENTVKERTAELENLNSVKDRFFAIVSHDLRNSISAFIGVGTLMNGNIKSQSWDGLKNLANLIDLEANKLNTFLNNLLEWSSTQLNQTSYEPEPIPVLKKCEEIKDRFSTALTQKKLQLTLDVEPNQTAFIDINAFDLIIRNILSNAIKFSFENGTIFIRSVQNDDVTIITVSDSGKGMSYNTVNSLFKLNLVQSQTGTKGEKGSGLGLVLVKEMVKINQGTISVNSQEGIGSNFVITFPSHASA